jgi:hypothetical protein
VFVCGVFEVFSVVDGGDENEMGEVRGDEGVGVSVEENGVDIGEDVGGVVGESGGGGNGIDGVVRGRTEQFSPEQKISTTFEYPPLLSTPPPKNILF